LVQLEFLLFRAELPQDVISIPHWCN